MANKIKKEIGDLKREELIKTLKDKGIKKWSKRNFSQKFEQFCIDYNLNQDDFYDDPSLDKPKLLIKKEWKGLFITLIRTYDKDPFLMDIEFDKNKITSKSILEYYDEVIKSIDEELEPVDSYSIKNSYEYITMIQEYEGLKKVTEKFSELASAISLISSKSRMNFLDELYYFLDTMILRVYEFELNLKEDTKDKENFLKEELKNNLNMYKFLRESESHNNGKIDEKELSTSFPMFQYMFKMGAFRNLIEEKETNKNISEVIADRLNKAVKIDNKDKNKYISKTEEEKAMLEEEFFGYKLREILEIIESEKELMQEISNGDEDYIDKLLKQKRERLIDELDEYLDKIKESYKNNNTVEKDYLEILEAMNSNNHTKLKEKFNQQGERKTKEYYEGYIDFMREVKEKSKSYKKHVSGIVEQPAIYARFNSDKK